MQHNCTDHLEFRESDSSERHGCDTGPYENFHDEWWQCRVCGARYTLEEAAGLIAREALAEEEA